MNPYLQSAFWLIGCGAIGYVLLEVTAPSADKLRAIRESSERQLSDTQRQKNELLMQKLAASATYSAKPVYLKTPAELQAENRRVAEK